jgi:hypothetical protein
MLPKDSALRSLQNVGCVFSLFTIPPFLSSQSRVIPSSWTLVDSVIPDPR